MAKEGQHERANSPLLAGPFPCVDARMSVAGGRGPTGGMAWRIGRCMGGVLQASITIKLIPGEYTALSRPIPSRATRSRATEPQAGTDRGPGMRLLNRLNVRFGPDYVRLASHRRHHPSPPSPVIGQNSFLTDD